jgi:hypothetical protein
VGYLNGTEVHENILAAVFRRNEAKALGLVEPLDRPFKFTHLRVFAGGILGGERYGAGYFVWIGKRKWVGMRDVFCIVRVGGAMCKAGVPKSNRTSGPLCRRRDEGAPVPIPRLFGRPGRKVAKIVRSSA